MKHDHIHWLGHASFRIEDGNRQIYIDPWKLPTRSPKADLILITHAHYDHFSPDDVAMIRKDTTRIFAPADVHSKLKGAVAVEPNGAYSFDDIRIHTVPAYNLDKEFHPKKNKWVGYILTLSGGQRIYHSGDSDAIPEMRTISTDAALLPCGGTYTMTAKEAAEIANTFKPGLLIPMHWGDIVGSKQDAEEVKRIFKGETIIKTPER